MAHLLLPYRLCDCPRDKPIIACLQGGSTQFRHFDRRLQLEVQHRVNGRLSSLSTGVPVKVHKHPKQRFAVWVGGSLLSAAPIFQTNCHTREEYLERGPSVCRQSHIMEA